MIAMGEVLDPTKEDRMVPAGMVRLSAAFKRGGGAIENRHAPHAASPRNSCEFVDQRRGEMARQLFLVFGKHIDAEVFAPGKDRMMVALGPQRPQDQRRIKRYRGKGVDRQAYRTVRCHRRYNRHAGGELPKGAAKSPGI